MKSREPSRQSGQILVLMALLSTTLIILFGMVVSIGHLVQAKINLQNAVDLAAMSGASYQARFMNHIALINYRMRQNYKFALYDLYVTQSKFNPGLQKQLNSITDPFDRLPKNRLTFGICQQRAGFKTYLKAFGEPGDGIEDGDLCRQADPDKGGGLSGGLIPPILPSPVVNTNPFYILANEYIIQLGRNLVRVCTEAADQNQYYFQYAMKQLNNRQEFQMLQMIEVLKEFSEAFSQGNDDVLNGKGRGDRTVANTFMANLIAANKADGAKLEYLNPPETRAIDALRDMGNEASIRSQVIDSPSPPGGIFANYFQRQKANFKMRYILFENVSGGCGTRIGESNSPGVLVGLSRSRVGAPASSPALDRDSNPVKLPLSVVLKATVQPRLLFWPRILPQPTLVAVGAAKPFGSRIGPPIEITNQEISGIPRSGENGDYALANMSFYPGDVDPNPNDSSTRIPGMGHKLILSFYEQQVMALAQSFGRGRGFEGDNDARPSVVNQSPNCAVPPGALPPPLCLSLSPTLYEGFFWNIFPFPASDASYSGSYADALISAFPSDVILKTADASLYNLPDRMRNPLAPSDPRVDAWHFTSLLGENPRVRMGRQPAFFADRVSYRSSWSPDLRKNQNPIGLLNPTAAETRGGDDAPLGRVGYQIKLVALKEVCQEIDDGQVLAGQYPKLMPYCNPNATTKVFH